MRRKGEVAEGIFEETMAMDFDQVEHIPNHKFKFAKFIER